MSERFPTALWRARRARGHRVLTGIAVLCTALCLTVLVGCRQVAPIMSPQPRPADAPAAPEIDGGTPRDRFLVADWYVDRFSTLADAADLFLIRQLRRTGLQESFRSWRGDLLRKYAPVLAAEGDYRVELQAAGLASLEKPEVIQAHLQALLDDLDKGIPMTADDSVHNWFQEPPLEDYADDFRHWLKRRAKTIAPPPQMRLRTLRDSIRRALTAAEVKQHLKEALVRAAEYQQRGQIPEALDVLEQASRRVPVKGGLQAIGDFDTTEALRQRLYDLPRTVIAETLREIDRNELAQARACIDRLGEPDETPGPCADAVSAAERRLTTNLRAWLDDTRLQEALQEYTTPIVELARLIARARGRVWGRDLALLAERDTVVAVVETADINLKSVQDYLPEQFFAYQYADARPLPQDPLPLSCAGLITAEIRLELARIAPRAMARLLVLAEREVDVSLHHGTAAALSSLALRLYDLLGPERTSAELTELKEKLAARSRRSTDFIEKNVAARRIAVDPFTAVQQGLGMTFTRDIENLLRDAVAASPAGPFLSVETAEEDLQPRDYLLTNGHIAAFNAEEPTETESIRKASGWGPVTAMPGKEGTDEAYAQPLIEYAIHVKGIERAAHVRFDFDLVHAGSRVPVRVNQFFRRTFVQESLHPFNDVRTVRTESAPRLDDLHEPEPKPDLANERVWTAAELLDWVRRQAQLLAVIRVLTAVDAYPLSLAEQARKARDAAAAANAWGVCVECLRNVAPENHELDIETPEDELDDALKEALRKRRRQLDDLHSLKSTVRRHLLEAMANLLKDDKREAR